MKKKTQSRSKKGGLNKKTAEPNKKSTTKRKVSVKKIVKKSATDVKPKKIKTAQRDFVPNTRIKVVGIGGGGGSIVNELAVKVKQIDFVAANTDIQALGKAIPKVKRFSFGQSLTSGLGAGMDPSVGKVAAEKEREKITKLFQGTNFSIIIACLGGGTGSGASPIFSEIAKETDEISFGIFTLPFKFEGQKRARIAQEAIRKIKPSLNAICIIPNDRIFRLIDRGTPLKKALSAINEILAENLEGLIELLYLPGLINIDFADLNNVLQRRGQVAYLNTAVSQKEDRAQDVLKKVLQNPLYQQSIKGADRVLFNISGGKELGMREVEYISENIANLNKKARIIFGVSHHNKYKKKIKVTLLATGCGEPEKILKKKSSKKKKGVKKRIIPSPLAVQKEVPSKAIVLLPPSSQPIGEASRSTSKSVSEGNKEKAVESAIKKGKSVVKKNTEEAEIVEPKEAESKKAEKIRTKPIKKKKKKKKKTAQDKPEPQAEEAVVNLQSSEPEKTRRNALDLAKEAREVEERLLDEEKKWETPAFLRRKKDNQ